MLWLLGKSSVSKGLGSLLGLLSPQCTPHIPKGAQALRSHVKPGLWNPAVSSPRAGREHLGFSHLPREPPSWVTFWLSLGGTPGLPWVAALLSWKNRQWGYFGKPVMRTSQAHGKAVKSKTMYFGRIQPGRHLTPPPPRNGEFFPYEATFPPEQGTCQLPPTLPPLPAPAGYWATSWAT